MPREESDCAEQVPALCNDDTAGCPSRYRAHVFSEAPSQTGSLPASHERVRGGRYVVRGRLIGTAALTQMMVTANSIPVILCRYRMGLHDVTARPCLGQNVLNGTRTRNLSIIDVQITCGKREQSERSDSA